MPTLLIRNATLIDGTGSPAVTADLFAENDRITDFGLLSADLHADTEIDAAGKVLAPGFIDIHTHADIALLSHPAHLPRVMQGVTTEVFTNCGLGFAPITGEALAIQRDYIGGLFGDDTGVSWGWRTVAEFLAEYEKKGIGTNAAYLIPHGSLRVSAMGMVARPATTAELKKMETMLREGMNEGAWGMSTGVWYAPMASAAQEELVTLTRTAGFFATHQRDYGTKIFEATEESLDIARKAGVPVQISHLQMNGIANKGRAGDLLALLDTARKNGVDVTCDAYPYIAGSTFVQTLLPLWATDGGSEMILKRLADTDTREKIVGEIESLRSDWDTYLLVGASSASVGHYEGEYFDEIARREGVRVGEVVCKILEAEELRACYVHFAAHEENVREVLRWEGQMVASDGLHLPGKTHPRLYGTFPRVLAKYVREERVISLSTAIAKMTSKPALRLGLKKRGTIAVGNFADLVLFDPETVLDVATFTDPLQYPDGISDVFVNGIAVKREGKATGVLPGRVLRKE